MEYARVGSSALKVSRIALGCMSYGDAGFHEWTLDEDASQTFFRRAVEPRITLWDTANGYGGGPSEEFVGRAINTYTRAKTSSWRPRCTTGPEGSGPSRKAILEQLDATLRRLGTEHIDLYYVHRFDDVVQCLHGHTRYDEHLAWHTEQDQRSITA